MAAFRNTFLKIYILPKSKAKNRGLFTRIRHSHVCLVSPFPYTIPTNFTNISSILIKWEESSQIEVRKDWAQRKVTTNYVTRVMRKPNSFRTGPTHIEQT